MISRRAVLIAGVAVSIKTTGTRALAPEPHKESQMDIDIKRNGSRPFQKGSDDWFTGTVRIDPLFQAPDPDRWTGLGAARGRAGRGNSSRGRGVVSAATEALARRLADDGDDPHRDTGIRWGKNVDWMEKVSDEQYRK
jgi:hypothetical protein